VIDGVLLVGWVGLTRGVPVNSLLTSALVSGLYEVGTLARWGMTVGDRVAGLRVRSNDGETVSVWRALRRWFFLAVLVGFTLIGALDISASLALFPVLTLAWPFVSRDGRGPQDLWAGTLVVVNEGAAVEVVKS
jgi:uncharacterized RDD family membrane protein YckC